MARRLTVAIVLALVPVVAVLGSPELRRLLRSDLWMLVRPATASGRNDGGGPGYIVGERETAELMRSVGRTAEWDERLTAGVRAGEPWAMAQELLRDARRLRGARLDLDAGVRPKIDSSLDPAQYAERARGYAAKDPGNAFFPLAECLGLLLAKRDDEATAALSRATRCGRYDSHGIEWRRFGAAHKDLLEDRLVLASRREDLLEAARLAGGLAEREEAFGRPVAGLAIVNDLLHLAGLVDRDSATSDDTQTADALLTAACGNRRAARIRQMHSYRFSSRTEALVDRRRRESETFLSLADHAERYGARGVAARARALASSNGDDDLSSVQAQSEPRRARIAVLRFAGLVLLGGAVVFGLAWVLVALAGRRERGTAPPWRAPALIACFVPELTAALGLLLRPRADWHDGYPWMLLTQSMAWQQWFAPATVAIASACGWVLWMVARGASGLPKKAVVALTVLLGLAVPALLAARAGWVDAVMLVGFAAAAGVLLTVVRPADSRSWWTSVAVAACVGVLYLPLNYLPLLAAAGGRHVVGDVLSLGFYMCASAAALVCGPWWLVARLRKRTVTSIVRGLFAVGLGFNAGVFGTLLSLIGRVIEITEMSLGLLPAAGAAAIAAIAVLYVRRRSAKPDEARSRALASVRLAAGSAFLLSLWLYAIMGHVGLPTRMAWHAELDRAARVGEVRSE